MLSWHEQRKAFLRNANSYTSVEEFLPYCTIPIIYLKKNSKEQVQRGNKNGEKNCKSVYQVRLGKLNMLENNSLKVWCTAVKGAQFKGDKCIGDFFKRFCTQCKVFLVIIKNNRRYFHMELVKFVKLIIPGGCL